MVLLWALGCTEQVETAVFLGELPGSDVRMAVSATDEDISVFVAGTGETLATHTRWFEGPRAEDGSFELETDGWLVSGKVLAGGAVDGDLVSPDGILTPFNASPTLAGTIDGPWSGPETGGGACRAGVVLYNSAFQVQGGYCPAEGEVVEVTAVDLDGTDGVIDLQAEIPDAPIQFEATPTFELPAQDGP